METKKNLIIASSNIELAEGIKKQIESKGYKVVTVEVSVEHLLEALEQHEKHHGNRIDGIIITTDIAKKLSDKRLEFLSDSLLTIREDYSHVQFIVLANESAGHPFLAEIFQMGIYNIFRKGEDDLSVDVFVKHLETPKKFSEVSKYRDVNPNIRWRKSFNGPHKVLIERQEEELKKEEKKEKDAEPVIESLKVEPVIEPPKPPEPEPVVSLNHTVGVLSLSKKAGSSFITTSFAAALTEHDISVSVLENPIESKARSYLFHALGIPTAETKDKQFYSVPHVIREDKKIDKEQVFKKSDVNWMVTDPRRPGIKAWSFTDMMRYLHSSNAAVTLMDMGWIIVQSGGKGVSYMLREFDTLLVVIDPLPQEVEANIESLRYLEEVRKQGTDVIYIINKMNKEVRLNNELGVDTKTEFRLINEMETKKAIQVPHVQPEFMYKAQFIQKLPFEINEVKEQLDKPMHELIKAVLPKVKLKKKQQSSFLSKLRKG